MYYTLEYEEYILGSAADLLWPSVSHLTSLYVCSFFTKAFLLHQGYVLT